jgi:hypothetical protein
MSDIMVLFVRGCSAMRIGDPVAGASLVLPKLRLVSLIRSGSVDREMFKHFDGSRD